MNNQRVSRKEAKQLYEGLRRSFSQMKRRLDQALSLLESMANDTSWKEESEDKEQDFVQNKS